MRKNNKIYIHIDFRFLCSSSMLWYFFLQNIHSYMTSILTKLIHKTFNSEIINFTWHYLCVMVQLSLLPLPAFRRESKFCQAFIWLSRCNIIFMNVKYHIALQDLKRSYNVNFPRHKLWVCFQLIIGFEYHIAVINFNICYYIKLFCIRVYYIIWQSLIWN